MSMKQRKPCLSPKPKTTSLIKSLHNEKRNHSANKEESKAMDLLLKDYLIRKQIKEQLKIINAKYSLVTLYKVYAERILDLENYLSNILLIVDSFSPQDKSFLGNVKKPSLQLHIAICGLLSIVAGTDKAFPNDLLFRRSAEWIEIVSIFNQHFSEIQNTLQEIQSLVQKGRINLNNMNYLNKYLKQLKQLIPNDYTFEKIEGVTFDKRAIDLCYYAEQFFQGFKLIEKDNIIFERKGKLPYEQTKKDAGMLDEIDPQNLSVQEIQKQEIIQGVIEPAATQKEQEKLKMINNFLSESPPKNQSESQSPSNQNKKSIKDIEALEALKQARYKPKVQYQKKEPIRKSANQILLDSKQQKENLLKQEKQNKINSQLLEYQKRMNAIQQLKEQQKQDEVINPTTEDEQKKKEGYVPFRRSFLIQKEKLRISQPENTIKEDDEPLEQDKPQKDFLKSNKIKAAEIAEKKQKKKRPSSEEIQKNTVNEQKKLEPKIQKQAQQILKQHEQTQDTQTSSQMKQQQIANSVHTQYKEKEEIKQQNSNITSKALQDIKQDIKIAKGKQSSETKQQDFQTIPEIKQSSLNSSTKKVQFEQKQASVHDEQNIADQFSVSIDKARLIDGKLKVSSESYANKVKNQPSNLQQPHETNNQTGKQNRKEEKQKEKVQPEIAKIAKQQTETIQVQSNNLQTTEQVKTHVKHITDKKQSTPEMKNASEMPIKKITPNKAENVKLPIEMFETPPKKDFISEQSPKSHKIANLQFESSPKVQNKRRLSARPDLGLHSFGLSKKLESIQSDQLNVLKKEEENKVQEVIEEKEKKKKGSKKNKKSTTESSQKKINE